MICNPKYAGHGVNFDWLLHYFEPVIVLKFAETQIIVDAKYKSYLYHKRSKSDTLRESFRNELTEKGMPRQYISTVASENGERYWILLTSKRLNGATKTQSFFFSVENAV